MVASVETMTNSAPYVYDSIASTSSLDPPTIIRLAEEKIRVKTIASGLRITEFFIDFDRLRSGFVTSSQFKRCLDTNLRVQLLPEEEQLLFQKYDLKHDGNICYREFCDVINRKYPETTITPHPESYTNAAPPYLNSWRSTRHIGAQDESERLKDVLQRIATHCKQRRIDVLQAMENYDKHKMGEITDSQFYRAFVGPQLTEAEMTLLRDKYSDPEKPGLMNYLNFVQDLNRYSRTNDTTLFPTNNGNNMEQTPFIGIEEKPEQRSIQEILDKIRIATFKYGVRISDFFKDYDKLRSGIMTETQFESALSLSIQKQAFLNMNDIKKIAEYYRRPDGRVYYKEFVDSMENAFNIPELEKKPLTQVHRPGQGLLSRPLNTNLSPEEEDRVAEILDVIIEKVKKRRLELFRFFKPYDRSKAFTRACTKHQFGRVLRTLDLIPSPYDFNILCKKFEDRENGDVNYALFCQMTEQDFVAIKVESEVEFPFERARIDEEQKRDKLNVTIDTSNVDLNDLMGRIRHHVLIKRIRVKEFFEDFDPLRLGTVSQARFIRVLASLGLTGLDGIPLTEAQMFALCDHYRHPEQRDLIQWKQFEQDVESVFTLSDLEKVPTLKVSPQTIYEMPTTGTPAWCNIDPYNKEELHQAMQTWKTNCEQRRIDLYHTFKQFDRHNRGHVTRGQFRQCLAIAGLPYTQKELEAVEAALIDDDGFHYRRFREWIQPRRIDPFRYNILQQELKDLNKQKILPEGNPLSSIQDVLQKIKGQVFRRRIRLYEWLKDHDKLNCGRLPCDTFRRAINPCQLELTESELSLLEDYYRSRIDVNAIEYKKFCEEIESIFTTDFLEKNPLVESEQYVPIKDTTNIQLDPDKEDRVQILMNKMGERVHARRLQLFPLFEDFDRVRNGHVTQNQFLRVLNDLGMLTMLSGFEKDNLLAKFRVRVGGRDDMDYITFCHELNTLAGFEAGIP
ncbi:unnamed protein product [Adineta steineri]|uniref:EF-hand domain-containing protein n=1 Tax=Adineta steineri TaxID=433720 RepID=A0A814W3Q2_9BILA|nr:unnamed protein product [Adineta steineri]CAF1196999.1 unnamed protein product [Adineta steineri]